MSGSWEDIANEVAPVGARTGGLVTGAARRAAQDARKSGGGARAHYTIPCPPVRPSATLNDALSGAASHCPTHGNHYSIVKPAHSYHHSYEALPIRLETALRSGRIEALSGAGLGELLFVDIETTGLSSTTPLFLIGALCTDGEPCLQFFLARDFEEERAALAAFRELAAGKWLITFNGKSFDWPYIKGRGAYHEVHFEAPPAHFDLLHHARAVWAGQTPNCRLQTLEAHLCRRVREDDVPSSRIPDQYHDFVRLHSASGRGAHLMAPIIHHNALDILTMAELLCIACDC